MNTAKFLPPKPLRVLDRERLMNKLLAWDGKKLIMLHGQAGQGKSTLAAEFVRQSRGKAVWYTLDQEDENPALFLGTLSQAVQRTWPDRIPHLPPVPQHRYGMGRIQQSLDRWTHQVFGNLPDSSLIVFDDYAGSAAGVQQEILRMLLAETPPHVRFLVISRVRPELELAKLRSSGSVGELTGEDLRFTEAEVRDLFSLVFHMQISPTEATLINSSAEGWPAGLALMHEYLQSLSPEARALALADRHALGFRSHVFDYLAQEVFLNLPEPLQQFLLKTSIADYLPAPLISLLTGLPDAASAKKQSVASVVRDLRNRNLFITAADEQASVIRYHALFREFLRKKLITQTRPSEAKKFFTTAADYFRKNNDPVRCADLLIESGQFAAAVKVIEQCGEDLIARGQIRTLLRWIEALPLEYSGRPWFLFYRAVAARFTDPRTALDFFEYAFRGFNADRSDKRRLPGMMLSLCGIIEGSFYTGGNFKRMAKAASAAEALLRTAGKRSPEARARLLLAIGTTWFFLGRLRQGAESLQEALSLFIAIQDNYLQIHTAIYLAPCAIYLGDFPLARTAVAKGFQALKAIPDETGGEAALHMAQTMTALFEGRFSEAQQCVEKCHALAREFDLEAFDFLSLDIGGWLKTATGDYAGAEALLRQCKTKGEATRNAFFNSSASHLLAVNYLHQNRLKEAETEAAQALAVREQSGSRLFAAISLAVRGAIELKQGRTAKAESTLDQARTVFHRDGAAQMEANVLLVLAKIALRKDHEHEADRLLNAGFRIGERLGFTYYVLFTHAELAELARLAIGRDICPEYCASLLGRASAPPTITVTCFGGFKTFRRRKPVADGEWRSSMAKALFKLLVAQDNAAVSRDVALDMLWSEEQPESPRVALNSVVARIRKVLCGPGGDAAHASAITVRDGTVVLDKNAVWTDVDQFSAHAAAAERLKAQAKPEQALKEYELAIGLYTGDFLPEDAAVEWTIPVRDRLRLRYLRALEDAAGLGEKINDHGTCLAMHEELFLADPCNETACRWLMTRYQSDGRRKDAIRTYERCERALSRDLDMEPGKDTRRVYRGIIEG